MRQNSRLFRQHGLYGVESYMSLRRTTVSFLIFQKDRQNLDRAKRYLGSVLQFQEDFWFRIQEPKGKRVLIIAHTSFPKQTKLFRVQSGDSNPIQQPGQQTSQ